MAIEKVIKIDLTITQSKIKIKDLEKQVKSLDGRTLKYRQALQRLRLEEQKLQSVQKLRSTGGKALIKSNESLVKSTNKVVDSSGLANTAVQELGRGASDSAFGIQGVANNASQLGSLFGALVQKTGSTTNALKAMWKSLRGPLGLVVAFQALTAVIQTDWFNSLLAGGKALQELNKINKQSSEIAGENVTKFKILTGVLLDKKSSDKDQLRAVKALNKDFESFNTNLITNATSYENAKLAADNFTATLLDQAKATAALELITKKQGEIILLEEKKRLILRNEFNSRDEKQFEERRKRLLELNARQFKDSDEATKKGEDRINKRFDAVKNRNKEEIQELTDQIESLAALANIKELVLSGGETKEKGKSPEDLERERQEKILAIRKKYSELNEDLDDENFGHSKTERNAERAEQELNELDATEFQKVELRLYYANLIKEEERKIIEDFDEWQEKQETEKEDRRLKKLLENARIEEEAKKAILNTQLNNVSGGFKALSSLAEKSKGLQIASIIADSAVGISKTVISTQAANSAVRLKYAPLPGGELLAAAATSANNIASGISIATITAAAAKGIGSLGGGGGGGSSSSSGGGGNQSAPSFNLIEGTQGNQIANAITTDQPPVKAYVVGSEMSTQQQLDRNKVEVSSL
jgi:hypothetical protein